MAVMKTYFLPFAIVLGMLMMIRPLTAQAQEISYEELSKIQITDSNRETILKKYQRAIYKCAGVTSADSVMIKIVGLSNIAKHAPVSDVPSKTIGELIKEFHLMKKEPEYTEVSKSLEFAYTHLKKTIDIKDKQKAIQPLTTLANKADGQNIDPISLINYIFSPACKGLTYEQGFLRFAEQQKKKK